MAGPMLGALCMGVEKPTNPKSYFVPILQMKVNFQR